jgi:hypothetical protein
MSLVSIIGLLSIIRAAPVSAAKYYIGADTKLDGTTPPYVVGDDKNPGTMQQPWKTFRHALCKSGKETRWDPSSGTTVLCENPSWVQPGDTLILLSGIYTQALDPSYGGQSGAPITISTEHDGQVVIDGEYKRDPLKLQAYKQAHYFVIEGLIFRNGNTVLNRDSNQDGTPDSVEGNGTVMNIDTSHNIFRRVSA